MQYFLTKNKINVFSRFNESTVHISEKLKPLIYGIGKIAPKVKILRIGSPVVKRHVMILLFSEKLIN